MNESTAHFSRISRSRRLASALAESVRLPRFDSPIINIREVLKAARLDPDIVRETRRIMSRLPNGSVDKFLSRYRDRDPSDRRIKSKYFNLPVHLAHAVWQARELGLYNAGGRFRIVDLGTGFGYFPFVCDSLGHRSTGLDWDLWKVYEKISADIPIDRRSWEVTPENPMPELGEPVDLVTAFRPVFYYEFDTDSLWAEEKWHTFFTSLLPSIAKGGAIFIGENRIDEVQKPHYRRIVDYFKELDGAPRCNGWFFDAGRLTERIAAR